MEIFDYILHIIGIFCIGLFPLGAIMAIPEALFLNDERIFKEGTFLNETGCIITMATISFFVSYIFTTDGGCQDSCRLS